MRVVAGRALGNPSHDVEALRSRVSDLVAVKEVGDHAGVAVGGELVGHQLAVDPDAEDVGHVDDAGVLVRLA